MNKFPRGQVFYRFDPEKIIGTFGSSSPRTTLKSVLESRGQTNDMTWRDRIKHVLLSCTATQHFDYQKEIAIDLSSPWPIGVPSKLNCSFDGKLWTMHPDVRLGTDLSVIHEMIITSDFPDLTSAWSTGDWKENPKHHVVRQTLWQCQFFGTDPAILMAMLLSVQNNGGKPTGFELNKK